MKWQLDVCLEWSSDGWLAIRPWELDLSSVDSQHAQLMGVVRAHRYHMLRLTYELCYNEKELFRLRLENPKWDPQEDFLKKLRAAIPKVDDHREPLIRQAELLNHNDGGTPFSFSLKRTPHTI